MKCLLVSAGIKLPQKQHFLYAFGYGKGNCGRTQDSLSSHGLEDTTEAEMDEVTALIFINVYFAGRNVFCYY